LRLPVPPVCPRAARRRSQARRWESFIEPKSLKKTYEAPRPRRTCTRNRSAKNW
jgi:hypothetical protein